MIGGQGIYLQPHHFQLDVGYRGFRSHWPNFNGKHRHREVTSYVYNKQQIEDIVLTYQVTRQTQLAFSLPIVGSSFSFLYGPAPKGFEKFPLQNRPRATERGGGIGDMSLVARRWLLPVDHFFTGNLAIGVGVKFPTGNWDQQSIYPNIITGRSLAMKANDQSIQPGDGGFGIVTDVSGFKKAGPLTLFGFGTYLVNPRNTNGTLSIIPNLIGPLPALKRFPQEFTNSVPDQYVGEVGFSAPIPGVRGLFASGAARIEGVPPTDLWGGSAGFRRPGFALFAEPGFSYTYGKNVWSISVPILTMANLMLLPTSGRHADATVPNWIILARYSRRF